MNLFLLGAGFNADAGTVRTPYGERCFYPLVGDVARLCFPSGIPAGTSVEGLFCEAKEKHDTGPMQRLTEKLMEADNYLAHKLASPGESNCYSDFFEAFAGANFLTFNYDSLPEIFLFRTGRWYADDGYGVPVETDLIFDAVLPVDRKSASKVVHLHGSHCLRASGFEIRGDTGRRFASLAMLERPTFKFDPDSLSSLFSPYRRVLPDASYERTHGRVIAPIPDKASELERPFVRALYGAADAMVRACGTLVAIGYSFNLHDCSSYNPILKALALTGDRTLVIVSPEAAEIERRLSREFPNLRLVAIENTFKGWSTDSFRYPRTIGRSV